MPLCLEGLTTPAIKNLISISYLRTGQSLLVVSLIGKLILGRKSQTKHANPAQLNKARVEMVEIKAY